MPLSDHEQRMLDQIESALYAEDPKFASSVRGGAFRAPSTKRRLQGGALFVVGVVVLVNQLEGNFLQPFLMGRSMKLHAFVILVALTVGTVLGGIVGAVLAVPIAAAAWGVIQVWDGPHRPARWARPKDPVEA